jgi:hypothetical protein
LPRARCHHLSSKLLLLLLVLLLQLLLLLLLLQLPRSRLLGLAPSAPPCR